MAMGRELGQGTPGGGLPAASGGSNPFRFLSGMLGGGGGGTSAPAANAPAAASDPLAPKRAPFNALLDPSQRNIFGLIGRLSGTPTREEAILGRQQDARQAGISGLMKRIQEGMPPEKALVDFLNTPEGANMFAQDPESLGQAIKALKEATPEKQDIMNIGAGGVAWDPNTQQELYRNPVTEVQEFNAMTEIGQLNEEERSLMAKAILESKVTGDGTQSERAIAQLVKQGLVSPETGQLLLAGVLEISPLLDAGGKTIGHVLINKANGTSQQIIGNTLPPPQPAVPGVTPPPEGSEVPGSALSRVTDRPGAIVRGAGPAAVIEEFFGSLFGSVDPNSAGTQVGAFRDALRQIRKDAQDLRGLSDESRGLKQDAEFLDDIYNMTGWTINPRQAVQKMLGFHDLLDRRYKLAIEILSDPTQTGRVKEDASKELQIIKGARLNLPSREDLLAEDELLKKEPGAIPAAIEEGEAAIEDAQLPSFASEADIGAALDAGEISYGDTIMFNGKRVRVKQPPNGGGGSRSKPASKTKSGARAREEIDRSMGGL